MSTYTALHIRSDQLIRLQKKLAEWLKTTHKTETVKIANVDSLSMLIDDMPRFGELYPSLLLMGLTQADWITVHYNSFYEMQDVASEVSQVLSCLVVVVLAQSTSESYFLSVHKDGETLRKLHWAGDIGDWIIQEGRPMSFESIPLGYNIGDEKEPFFVFNRQAAIEYCKNLGLHIWDEIYEPKTWISLQVSIR